MYMTDEQMDEMATTLAPCACDLCANEDERMAFLMQEWSWDEVGL